MQYLLEADDSPVIEFDLRIPSPFIVGLLWRLSSIFFIASKAYGRSICKIQFIESVSGWGYLKQANW